MDLFSLYQDKKFYFREISLDDLEYLMNLRNHPSTRKFLGDDSIVTIQGQLNWYNFIKHSKEKKYYIIEYLNFVDDNIKKIGMIRTHDIDTRNKSIAVGGDIDPAHRGNGYAKIMYNLIFRHVFEVLEFNKIWLCVLENNTIARTLYKKLGFIETGIQREAIYRNDKYYDYIYMDILKSEYNKLNIR